ncbi:hypothetical protein CAP36_06610 [Chitinophagaceae bacterium IBVUCB2]|nr:hypothetical protein CAP36_06610 [Chitinophagaceae bacterium IBVUCB2]
MNKGHSVHLKGLNGIRAIAAFAVVISHTLQFSKAFGLPESKGIDLAGFGVSIFFALSGFLITYLLLIEKEKFSAINIKAFYLRRILRIWPLYFFYLFISVVIIMVYDLYDLPGSLFYYFILAANIPFILGIDIPLLGHYWSLGVEEQFYLFWPWIVKRATNLVKVLVVFISVFILLKIAFRILQIQTGIAWPYSAIHVSRFECMAIGALGAVLFYREKQQFLKIVFHPVTQLVAWMVIILMAINKFHIVSVIDNDIVAAITVVIIVNVAANKNTLVRLDFKPLDFLGKISFGLYIYHPIVLFFSLKAITGVTESMGNTGKYITLLSFVIILTILIAWLSYEFFEKRFLTIKNKFAPVKSSATG